MEFTCGNHLTYSINQNKFGYRETPFDRYEVSVGKVDLDYYRHNSWLNEQHRIGSLVLNNIGKDFVLLYSGLNSECILRVLISLNIKPILIFIRFVGDYNLNEYYHAVKTASDLGLELSVFDYDIIDSYRSKELTEFADSINCGNIMQAVLCHVTHKLQSPAIIGQEITFRKDIKLNSADWYYYFPENANASILRYSLKYNIPVISEWFSYTPESIGYFLDKLDFHNYQYKISTNSVQNQLFLDMFPNLTHINHRNGYENLFGLLTEFNVRGNQLHSGLDHVVSGIRLDDLKLQLFGKEYVNS